MKLSDGCAALEWGKVLGTVKYRVYKKHIGSSKAEMIYEGPLNSWKDYDPDIRKSAAYPDDRRLTGDTADYPEYYVTAVNGRGESAPSPSVMADPLSWDNWYPDTELKFKRRSAFWMPPYVYPDMSPAEYYPD